MGKRVLGILAAGLLGSTAYAADLPVKAPPLPAATAYPYQTAGLYWGVTAYAAQTSLNVNAPGADSGDVVAVGGSVGLLGGYSMPLSGGAAFGAFEVSAATQNIGASGAQSAGILSFKGPWRVEAIAKYGVPCANLTSMLPNLGSILPTLPALPAGLVATNCHAYIGGGAAGEDISATLNLNTGGSVGSGSEWSLSGVIKTGQIWQLSSGAAVETWIEYETNGRSFGLSGSPMFTPSIQGQDHKILVGINYML
jgi:hypothetical protein